VDTWFWDFGDGETSSARNPSHIYTRPGIFTVTLTISDPVDSHSHTQTDFIRVVSPDRDDDGDVDQEDFGRFQVCLTSPGQSLLPGCETADLDLDNDLDRYDLVLFQRCMSGANVPLNPGCANP
jgi:PKD repeat protein